MNSSKVGQKLKVWVIQTGEPLHVDDNGVRPMRAMNLCNALIGAGHEVVLWSSAFDHTKKEHRTKEFLSIDDEKMTTNLIPSPGYSDHKSFKRILDHIILALNFNKVVKTKEVDLPDVAFIGFPPVEISYVALKWLKAKGIPSVIDVKDQWPEAFIENTPIILPGILKPILKFIFYPYKYLTIAALKNATAFCSMSDSYLRWMANLSGRDITKNDMVVPLTTSIPEVSSEEFLSAKIWWKDHGVCLDTKRRLHFIGSLSPSFDFLIIRDVAKNFEKNDIDCQFVICGEGSELNKVKEIMSGLKNVVFPGWIDTSKIKALSSSSFGSLAPYRNTDNFTMNIPNKILDSLASGLPIFTTLEGEVKQLIEFSESGFSTVSASEMEENILSLLDNIELRESMSKNAKELYSKRFSKDLVYNDLVKRLECLVRESANERIL